jgi:superfamily I DNA/RNA helicase
MQPSRYQSAIYDFVTQGEGSAVVIAVAGSGKTTTLRHALPLIPAGQSVQVLMFNTDVAKYFRAQLPLPLQPIARTFHSIGYGALCQHFGMKQLETNSRKLQALCRAGWDWPTRQRYEAFVCRLVSLAKGNGIGAIPGSRDPGSTDLGSTDLEVRGTGDRRVWADLIAHHDLYLDDPKATEDQAIRMARDLLAESIRTAEDDYQIDFDDQLYLTVKWHLAVDQKDWVFVDEAQDTNPIRRALIGMILKPGGRLLAVGDPKQAIYGFTGASHDAIDLIQSQWACLELPLSVCYRCPTKVVEKAQQLVDYIECAPNAPEGLVETLTQRETLTRLTQADAVLCRNNAPLVELAYWCLAQQIPCQILGRDIGKGLQILVDKMQAPHIDALQRRLADYRTREVRRLLDLDQPAKAQSVADRVDCLYAVIDHLGEEYRTLYGLCKATDRLFGDDTTGRLTLSTVHKAKGKEWPQVAILKPELMPAPWAKEGWQRDQEEHVMYVAWTRAKEALYFIRD